MPHKSRVAIVTGAAGGIGAAIATTLAEGGHAVGVLDLSADAAEQTAAAIRMAGGRATAVVADVTQEASVAAAVDAVARDLGEPTILVNNAGIIRDNLLHKMSVDEWDAVASVHLRGAFLMTRAVQSFMVKSRFGRIVNLSSTSALGNRGQVNYSAAKAGLQGFTKTVAIELGPYGVTANAIAPGFIVTDMTRATAARLRMDFDELSESITATIPVGRPGQPEDVARLADYLASEGAGFVSGQVIYVAGGPTD
ncbi:MAG: 3-oxoacyl-ACP reductase FabG [Solirubrobacterales bacterium]